MTVANRIANTVERSGLDGVYAVDLIDELTLDEPNAVTRTRSVERIEFADGSCICLDLESGVWYIGYADKEFC